MTHIIFTAARELQGGNALGDSVELEFSPANIVRKQETVSNQQKSIGGYTETILDRLEYRWMATSSLIDRDDLAPWREYFSSVMGGETHTFDPFGTIAAPLAPVLVILINNTITETPVSPRLYTFTFEVRILP